MSPNDLNFDYNHPIDLNTSEYIHNIDVSNEVYNDIPITNPISSFSAKLQSKINTTEIDLSFDIPTAIHGSIEFQESIRAKCLEFKDIFSKSICKEPALVPSLQLKLNQKLWALTRNRLPARSQSLANQRELLIQLTKMLDLGVIKRSEATHWSQVL